jgi:hypothetical protein
MRRVTNVYIEEDLLELIHITHSTMSLPDLPSVQKAVVFNTHTTTLSLSTERPVPTPSSSLLLRVHSTAITNGELTWGPFVNWPENHVPCFDVSGTVVRLPSGPSTSSPSSRFKIGDRVYGRIAADRDGAARSYAMISESEAAHVPKGLGMLEASTVPMSAHTAWQAVFEHGLLCSTFSVTSIPHVTDEGKLASSIQSSPLSHGAVNRTVDAFADKNGEFLNRVRDTDFDRRRHPQPNTRKRSAYPGCCRWGRVDGCAACQACGCMGRWDGE